MFIIQFRCCHYFRYFREFDPIFIKVTFDLESKWVDFLKYFSIKALRDGIPIIFDHKIINLTNIDMESIDSKLDKWGNSLVNFRYVSKEILLLFCWLLAIKVDLYYWHRCKKYFIKLTQLKWLLLFVSYIN